MTKNVTSHADSIQSAPIDESWIYQNPSTIESLRKGIHEIEIGRTRKVKLPVIKSAKKVLKKMAV